VLTTLWIGGCLCLTNPPQVLSTSPTDGATSVATSTVIVVTFDRSAVTSGLSIQITPTTAFTLEWSQSDTVATATPTAQLASNTTYTVTIAACDFTDGCSLPAPTSFTFTSETDTTNGGGLQPNARYVASSGSDSNPGTSTAPWRTIQHAADTLVAGDTVYIRGGIYHENVWMARGGTNGGYITFSAYPGETPVIDGTGVTGSGNGVIISQSYIKLTGLEIRNWTENAVWVENAAYFELSDCVVHSSCGGIGVADGSHDFVCNHVRAHDFDLYGFDVSPCGGADCHNGMFNDCVAHTGRGPTQNVDGFALGHGTQHDFVFNRCQAYAVYDGFDISSRNTTLSRCSAHNCGNGGYKLWQDNITLVNCLSYDNAVSNVELDWDGHAGTTTLWNCTCVNSETFNVWVENAGDSLRMYNCILAGGDGIGLAFEQLGVSNYQGDYNLFHNDDAGRAIEVGYTDQFSLSQVRSGSWTSYSRQDAHSLTGASLAAIFVDPANADFHLAAGSPAIDKGTSAGAPAEDYDGAARPPGSAIDIGAFER
jgi:hypothetical protein